MRKFTKEIAALLAAVSVSTSANMAMTNTETTHAALNAAEQNQPSFTTTAGAVAATTRVGTEVATTATTTRAKVTSQLAPAPGSTMPPDEGVAMPPDEDVTFPPEDGVAMPPDEYTTTTRATTTTTIGTQTSKLTTTTTTTTTTTVGTEVSKLTTTTAVPANDRIELPLEEIDIDEALWNNDEIEDHYASFYAQCAEYVVLQYSVEGDCDEIEGVFITAVDHELVKEFFTAAVKNGIATVSYRVPFNSDDYITAAVFDSKEKGVNLEKVELVNLESGRTTTTLPPLMGTIVATQPVSTTPAISTTPVMSPGEDIELYTEDLNVGTETDDNGETYTYFEFDPNNADFVSFCFTKEGDTIPFTFNLIIPTPYGPVVMEYPEYISGGELEIGITVPAAYHGGIIRAEYYDSRVNIDKVVFSKFEDPDTTVPPLAGVPLPPDEYTTTTVPPLAGVTTSTRPRQTDIPPLMGTQTIPTSTTTQTYIAGGMMPSDEKTTTTTTTTTPTIGTQMPTTVPTTIPPLMGDMQIRIDGDANNDSIVSIADAAAILQYIANPDKYGLSENGMIAADVVGNGNGITADDAIAIQKLDAKLIEDFSELE